MKPARRRRSREMVCCGAVGVYCSLFGGVALPFSKSSWWVGGFEDQAIEKGWEVHKPTEGMVR